MKSNDRYLYHVTLQSGDSRKSYRSEVSDDAIVMCQRFLRAIETDGRTEISGFPGFFIDGFAHGKCARFYVRAGSELILAFGVAENERCGAALWRGLHNAEGLPTKTDAERQPKAPWIGVAIAEGLINHQSAGPFLADFERCIGWAFLESIESRF